VVIKDNTNCDDLRKLITNLRHGTAHASIEFEDTGGKIDQVTIRNQYQDINWQVKITVTNLRDFVQRFAALLSDEKVFPDDL